MNKIVLKKIPYLFKNTPLPKGVTLSTAIPAEEGTMVVVQAQNHLGKKNDLDYATGRQGWLWEGDIIPAVLGNRKAATEFAGIVPKKVSVNDELYLLCESGLVGAIEGVYPTWGTPMKVKVLGSICDKNQNPMNLRMFTKYAAKNKQIKKHTPLVIFLSTIMDAGKTTMACKLSNELIKQGKKIAAVKLTGVAFSQDLMKLHDAGVSSINDFVDLGLPSTCNDDSEKIVQSALNLIDLAKQNNPDCIVVELGDGVLGEYHVADILQNNSFATQIKAVILAAKDFAGIKGTKDILSGWNIGVDLVTGPIANSDLGIKLIDKYFGLPAESNQGEIPKTVRLITEKILEKGEEI